MTKRKKINLLLKEDKMEIIGKLQNLGWKPRPYHDQDEEDFYLRRRFEVSKAKELECYTDYTPLPDEKIYIAYQLYPNQRKAEWCIWKENESPGNVFWGEDDFSNAIELAIQDKLFTYLE
jgi:hypothetical protein